MYKNFALVQTEIVVISDLVTSLLGLNWARCSLTLKCIIVCTIGVLMVPSLLSYFSFYNTDHCTDL